MDKKVEKKSNIKIIVAVLLVVAVASAGVYFVYSKNKKNIKQDVNYPCKLQHLRKRVLKIKQTFHFTTITDRANPEGL